MESFTRPEAQTYGSGSFDKNSVILVDNNANSKIHQLQTSEDMSEESYEDEESDCQELLEEGIPCMEDSNVEPYYEDHQQQNDRYN